MHDHIQKKSQILVAPYGLAPVMSPTCPKIAEIHKMGRSSSIWAENLGK